MAMPVSGFKSTHLDHLGLVAAMFDELGIGETIDSTIEQDMEKRHVSLGQVVKAMVLNGLGFVNQTLYLTPHFLEKMPIDRLIGPSVKPHYFNDDVMGRCLDSLYKNNLDLLYCKISTKALAQLALLSAMNFHLDSTTFYGYGEYHDSEPGTIRLERGYSKDHRPDLKQAVLNLIVENQAGIPFLMVPANGNANDKKGFRALINTHVQQLKEASMQYLIADSALYCEESLKLFSRYQINWITRVPETSKAANYALEHVKLSHMQPLSEGYRYQVVGSHYAGIQQRWLVVHSQAAQAKAAQSALHQLGKATAQEAQSYAQFCKKRFACVADALKAHETFAKGLNYGQVINAGVIEHKSYSGPGRPSAKKGVEKIEYGVAGQLVFDSQLYRHYIERKGCFIIGTNECDQDKLSDADCLSLYKAQNSTVERGFRFLKDPLFLADRLFLEKPRRIMALMMVMTICLLVYAALEYKIRKTLKEQSAFFPNQVGKPIQNPTARWVFFYFRGIDVLILESGKTLILNKNEHHIILIGLLGAAYEYYYS